MMLKINFIKRILYAIKTIVSTYGIRTIPILIGIFIYLIFVRILLYIGLLIDWILIKQIRNGKINDTIVIVGNPRSGTTFLHRFLVKLGLGTGTELWQMIFPSIIIQKLLKPIIPYVESISPTRYHSSDAHKTSLKSIETDDASMLFRFFDGFFLYGFIFAWANENLFDWVDPIKRNMSKRDFNWFESLWLRIIYSSNQDRNIAKLFSISANLPAFQERFPNTKILYMLRDPLNVIPSGLSLVTGVLDKSLGFWSLPEEKRSLYINRLYKALITLLLRFHNDWVNGNIDKSKIMIVKFDTMMNNFEVLMEDIFKLIDYKPSQDILDSINETAEKQRNYSSKHSYDLDKFGLSEEQIRQDCKAIYETFLTSEDHNV